MKRRTVYILVGILVLIIFLFIAKKAGWLGKEKGIEVAVEAASLRSITETVTGNGKIQPEIEVKISADVSGEIVELYVKEGQKVKKGDHLLTINPDLIKAAADRVAAALNQAKANLANSKARESQVKAVFVNSELTFNRSKKLHDQKAISEAEFENAQSTFEGAKADLEAAKQTVIASDYSVKSAEATLKEANDNLSRTRIYSPTDGTVSKLNVELGERVVGTAQMTGTELLRIANLNEMEVSVEVNENDIVRITLNDTAVVEVDAYEERKFKGVVTEIANSSTGSGLAVSASDQVTNFSVKIRILRESYSDLTDTLNPHLSPFRPGMSANVEIRTHTEKNVIAVPLMAVTIRSKKDALKDKKKGKPQNEEENEGDAEVISEKEDLKEIVFVYDSVTSTVRSVEVETGIQDNDYIRIVKGVNKGQEVISAPYSAISKLLKDSMKVSKTDIEKLSFGDKK